MADDLRTTIKKLIRTHLKKKIGKVFGQCLTAVGWVGGTLPELYEENNELPTVYNNLLNNTNKKNNKFRLKRKTNNNSKNEVFQNNFGFSNI